MENQSKPDMDASACANSSQARRAGLLWFERICVFVGLTLLLVFAGFQLQQSESSEAGLVAFYQQVEAATLAEPAAGDPGSNGIVATDSNLPAAASKGIAVPLEPPEFGLWSDKRIRDYQESLAQVTDAPLGVLRIERLNIEVPVYNGTEEVILNRGVGRIIGTARINDDGNLGIAGHRDGFFRPLKDIKTGDVLELQTIHGAMRYRVGSTAIVDPSDVSVLAPTPERTITLVTCYPFYFVGHAPKRFIVQATAEPHMAMN